MAKHYLIAVEDKDEKLFRLFCEKNSKYAMVIGKETTNDRLGLDHLVYILNSISNQVGKSIGIKEWDYLRNYLKKRVVFYRTYISFVPKVKNVHLNLKKQNGGKVDEWLT